MLRKLMFTPRVHQSLGGVSDGVLLVGHNRKESESARVPTQRQRVDGSI